MGHPLFKLLAASLIKIAVLDTGIDRLSTISLCPSGHRSFVDSYPLKDSTYEKHGTHVAKLISRKGVCIISIKIFKDRTTSLAAIKKALKYVSTLPVDRINMSFGGRGYNFIEHALIVRLLDKGVRVVAAAGNQNEKLTQKNCQYYPACYDPRIVVVGSLNPHSSYGPVVDIVVPTQQATSFATAIVTGAP